MDKLKSQLAGIAALIGVLGAIGAGFVKYGEMQEQLNNVSGIDISPSDTLRTDFMIITDQDSVKHWFVRTTVDGGILVGDNWCHRHEQWEKVEKK